MNNALKRTTLLVRDMDRAKTFYTEAMGLTPWYDAEIMVSGGILPAGSAETQTLLCILQAQDPEFGMLGLLQYVDPPLPDPGRIVLRLGVGNVVLIWETDDIETCYAKVHSHGGHIVAEPTRWREPNAEGTVDPVLTFSFFDPDGYFSEVIYRP